MVLRSITGTDRRVLALAFARMADALGNSFLIIVLPLYIGSGQIPLTDLTGTTVLAVDAPAIRLAGTTVFGGFRFDGLLLTEAFLIGVVLSLFGFLNSLAQPFTGRLSDRTRKRKVFILFGLVVFGIASAAYPFVTDYRAILAVRAFQGLGAAFTIPCTVALVNEFAASDAERGGNFGVFNTFRLIGFGFGPIVAGILIAAGPYSTPLGALSGFDAAFAVAVLGAIVSFTLVTVLVSDPKSSDTAAADDLSLSLFDRDGAHLFDPIFILGVATFFMAVGIALFATLQEVINARLGQGEFLFSVQFAAVVIANVLFQVPVGQASDRYGRRPFLLAGFVIMIPSVLAQGYVVSPVLMLIARLFQGLSVALVFAPSLALAGDLAGSGQSGTQLSVLTMAFGLGVAIGPLASGYLVRFGFATPFVFGSALAVLALVLTYTQVEESLSTGARAPEAIPQDD